MNINTIIISKLLVTARGLEKAGDEIFYHFGITLGMYEIMMLIADQIDTTTKLAKISQITLASITHKTKLMEDKGYIQRIVKKEDKRVWRFSLTPKGQVLLETIHAMYEEMTVPLFAQFSDPDKQQVLKFLTMTEEHLGHVLQNRQMIAEFVDNLIKEKAYNLNNIIH